VLGGSTCMADGSPDTRLSWRRRWQRAQALGPAYFQVTVRWIGWALALVITLVGGAPAINRESAGPFLALTFLQTALFTIYYPLLHHGLRPLLRRSGLHRRQGGVLWAVVDLLLSMAAVAGTGGFRSPFFQYALTSVMFPALVFRWRGALVAATAFDGLYLLAVLLSGDGLAGVLRAGQLDSLVAAFADAYLIGLFSAYLAALVHRVEVERRRTAAISRETRALYAVAQSVLESPPEVEALYRQAVAAVRRHLSLAGFGIYAAETPLATLIAGYGVPASLPSHTLAEPAAGDDPIDKASPSATPFVAAPLRVDEQVVAWLVAAHRPGAAAPTEAVVQALAGQVTLGLRGAALAREKAELAAAGERTRLAREIHDGVAQSLYMLTLNLEACAELAAAGAGGGSEAAGRADSPGGLDGTAGSAISKPAADPPTAGARSSAPALAARLEQLLGLARQALWEVRHYIFDLKPLLGGEAPLADVLRNPLREFQTIAGLPAELRTSGAERPLTPRARAAVYRVLQEALANAFKHAHGTRVDVALRWDPGELVLEVSDDGCGFEPSVQPRGHGLDNVAGRAADVGGRAAIQSQPGSGTCVQMFVPYANV
jgi:signal transduction histidine kinase